MTVISSRDFNRDVSAAKRAADDGPVTITDRGEPAYVLLTSKDFESLSDRRSIVDRLRQDIALDFAPEILSDHPRAAEL